MRKALPFFLAGLIGVATMGPAAALRFRLNGTTLFLSGAIELGDPGRLEQFLADRGNPKITTVVLNSPGGWLVNATEIARILRRMQVTTVVDARTAICASACTVLFAAGVRRHYINSEGVREGVFERHVTGLGFHQASNTRDNERVAMRSAGAGTGTLVAAYHEFGVGRAGELAMRASGKALFRINGQTALETGVATSLARP